MLKGETVMPPVYWRRLVSSMEWQILRALLRSIVALWSNGWWKIVLSRRILIGSWPIQKPAPSASDPSRKTRGVCTWHAHSVSTSSAGFVWPPGASMVTGRAATMPATGDHCYRADCRLSYSPFLRGAIIKSTVCWLLQVVINRFQKGLTAVTGFEGLLHHCSVQTSEVWM